MEELETALLGADVGVPATEHLLDDLRARWKRLAPTPIRAALLRVARPSSSRRSSSRS